MRRVVRRIKLFQALHLEGQRGQIVVIVAGAFVAFLALVGLSVDVATIYVNHDHLRRAVDAGAVAAVGQYRENRYGFELDDAARQAIELQLPNAQNVQFHWCNTGDELQYHDPNICTDPVSQTTERKLVRVEADMDVYLVFLRLLGFEKVSLHAYAEAEAAVLNLVLLIDTSESMAFDTPGCDWSTEGGAYACLTNCVAGAGCWPFDGSSSGASVRWAAHEFVDRLMRDGVDKVAVYQFDKRPVAEESTESFCCRLPAAGPSYPSDPGDCARRITITVTQSSGAVEPLTRVKTDVLNAINDDTRLNVYIRPQACTDPANPATCCDSPVQVGGFWGQGRDGWPWNQDHLGYGFRWANTNIGGGLHEAVQEFEDNGDTDAVVWAIVLISDGGANATDLASDSNGWFTCPSATGDGLDHRNRYNGPFCADPECDGCPITRHCASQPDCDRGSPWDQIYTGNPGLAYDPWLYDADDYARDMADLASSKGISIYTIGFGDEVVNGSLYGSRPDAGEQLLRYIADVGDLDVRNPCGSDLYWKGGGLPPPAGTNCGNYYHAPEAEDLEEALEDIVSRIFSRITQ